MGDREKRVGREFTRGGLGGRKRRGDLRRGIEGRGQGGLIHYQELQIWRRG